VDLGLKDATAVVVGGGRGMGLAAARCLADDGARVALVGRTRAVLDSPTADLILRGSPDAVALEADAEDEQHVQGVFEEISDRWGGELNILINTVGPSVQANINVDGGSDFS
jgi:3-oxoacyl-[acyl-carrier protein] reductase